jgi:hypothetical protein
VQRFGFEGPRESLVSLGLLLSFFNETPKPELHMKTVVNDLTSLSDHASCISTKINFLLDATLGLINIKQNGIIKIVSVAAVVFLPPTPVASLRDEFRCDALTQIDALFDCIRRGLDSGTDVSSMASTAESAAEVVPELEVPVTEVLRVGETKASRRSFYRLESGRLLPCEPNQAQIIAYTSRTIDDEAELQEQYNIDYHTLQSSLRRALAIGDRARSCRDSLQTPQEASAPTTIS